MIPSLLYLLNRHVHITVSYFYHMKLFLKTPFSAKVNVESDGLVYNHEQMYVNLHEVE